MPTVVVIGGGITGLSTCYYLQKQLAPGSRSDTNIILIESSEQLGGKIKTVQHGDFYMEVGADSVITRKTNVAPLLAELGIEDRVVYNATGISYIHTAGQLKQIPEDAIFGIPLSIQGLVESTLVSDAAKVEAIKDYYTQVDHFTKDDSIGRFLEACLGKELVEKQIAPVLSGVYSGHLQELTIASTMPYLLDYKREYGSILRGLAENRAKFKGNGDKKFFSFDRGMSVLIEALEAKISPFVDIQKGVEVQRVIPQGNHYSIQRSDGAELMADCVVLSTPNGVTEWLLDAPELAPYFAQLQHKSLISVYMAFDLPDSVLPMEGTGFITAQDSELRCDACTWTSRKWEHTSKEHRLLVRLFYKDSNPVFKELIELSNEEVLHEARQDLAASLGITAAPISFEVTPWIHKMPYYHMQHHQAVKGLEQQLATHYPGIYMAGCSYYGVGIPDCIASGECTANDIIARMTSQVTSC